MPLRRTGTPVTCAQKPGPRLCSAPLRKSYALRCVRGTSGRPMADMANAASTKPLIYDRLSFPDYNLIVPVWTPSGSCALCLTPPCYQLHKPPETAALFLRLHPGRNHHRLETILGVV